VFFAVNCGLCYPERSRRVNRKDAKKKRKVSQRETNSFVTDLNKIRFFNLPRRPWTFGRYPKIITLHLTSRAMLSWSKQNTA
jgi:hypothetical protein